MLEFVSLMNLAAFAYFTAVAYEHFWMGTKNPKLLQAEAHRIEVMRASREAQKRYDAKQKEMERNEAVQAEASRRSMVLEQQAAAEVNAQYG